MRNLATVLLAKTPEPSKDPEQQIYEGVAAGPWGLDHFVETMRQIGAVRVEPGRDGPDSIVPTLIRGSQKVSGQIDRYRWQLQPGLEIRYSYSHDDNTATVDAFLSPEAVFGEVERLLLEGYTPARE